VVDHPYVSIGGGQRVGDLGRAVSRLVVDDDQFVVPNRAAGHHDVANRLGLRDRTLDVGLLVPHREEDREQVGRSSIRANPVNILGHVGVQGSGRRGAE